MSPCQKRVDDIFINDIWATHCISAFYKSTVWITNFENLQLASWIGFGLELIFFVFPNRTKHVQIWLKHNNLVKVEHLCLKEERSNVDSVSRANRVSEEFLWEMAEYRFITSLRNVPLRQLLSYLMFIKWLFQAFLQAAITAVKEKMSYQISTKCNIFFKPKLLQWKASKISSSLLGSWERLY